MERIQLVAPSKATVLLTGETGTGKELVAQSIHQNSDRSGAFRPVHLPPSRQSSRKRTFRSEKGAFTGPTKRVGRFESAHGGTLFLDEIGEIDASTQVNFFAFETKSVERLGSSNTIEIDTRLVCATNRDLVSMIRKDEFREDLFYRLNVVTVELPPLRERGEDILLLIDHFLSIYADENQFDRPKLSKEAFNILKVYSWPGNIRELRNFCENLVVLKRGDEITPMILIRVLRCKKTAKMQPNKRPLTPCPLRKMKKASQKCLGQSQRESHEAAELMGIAAERSIANCPDGRTDLR